MDEFRRKSTTKSGGKAKNSDAVLKGDRNCASASKEKRKTKKKVKGGDDSGVVQFTNLGDL